MDHLYHLAEEDGISIARPWLRLATLRALILSASIHGLGLWLLTNLTPAALPPEITAAPAPLRLSIIAPAPIALEPGPENTGADGDEPSIPVVESSVPVTIPPRGDRVDVPSDQPAAPLAEPAAAESNSVKLVTPSTFALRQIVNMSLETDSVGRPAFECTAVQLGNEMLTCDNRSDAGFDASSRTIANMHFAGSPGASRTERSVRLRSSHSDEIAKTLLQGGLSDDFVDRFLGDRKSFAADYSTTEDSKLKMLRDQMYSNDSTYQQRKRALLE